MIIIKSMLFLLTMIFIIYRYGIIIKKITKKDKIEEIFVFGFILFLATSQLILTPCALLHSSFNNCLISMVIITLILLAISFLLPNENKKEKILNLKNIINKLKLMTIKDKTITGIMILLIIFQTIFTTILFYENADDSYYVSLSTTNIDTESVYMEEPSMGYKKENESLLLPTEQIPTYELNIAVLSKIFNIGPAIIYHTLLPIILIPIAYMTYYYFAKCFMDKKYAKIFTIILSIIFMFALFTTKFRTGCLLCKIWQGKAIFLNIVLNIIIASLIKIDKRVTKSDIIILMISNLSAVHLTSTAIFLIAFVYIPFGMLKLIKRKFKDIIYLIITFVPMIIYVIILVFLMKTHSTEVVYPQNPVNVLDCFKLYGNNIYLIYYFISLIIILVMGNKRAKKYFILVQLINLFTIWNPLFSNLIAKYLTSSDTFWRVFWILPLEASIAYAIVVLIQNIKNTKIKVVVFLVCIIAIIIPGKFVYRTRPSENLEKVSQAVLDNTNYILEKGKDSEKIVVLTPPDIFHSCMMRQLSSKIHLIYSRDFYVGKINNQEEAEERLTLEDICYVSHNYKIDDFNNLLDKYKIDWIIVNSNDEETINYVDKSILNNKIEMSGYFLYSR